MTNTDVELSEYNVEEWSSLSSNFSKLYASLIQTGLRNYTCKLKKLKPDNFFMGKPSQNYGVSPKYGVTTHPALTPSNKAGTRFTYPGGMERWVDLSVLITPRPARDVLHASTNSGASQAKSWQNVDIIFIVS